MRYLLKKNGYEAQIDTAGAELLSLKKDGREVMWNRDPLYWGNSSLVLFPFIGRNCNDTYLLNGKEHRMGIHGFAQACAFTVLDRKEDVLTLLLKDNEETLKNYPFHFEMRICFSLESDGISIRFEVSNRSECALPFNLGFHPGFILEKPLDRYRVFFPKMSDPREIGIVKKCMLNGIDTPLSLPDNCIHLEKELFKESARVYAGMGDTAVLQDGCRDLLSITYKGFDNIVLWQTLDSDADFICIEGWNGLPGRYERIEDAYDAAGRKILETGESMHQDVRIRFS